MNGIDPIITVHTGTGAFRAITPNLLAEAYLAPRPEAFDLTEALSVDGQPWSASMVVAPMETTAAVSSALRALALATKNISPDEIDLSGLDQDSRLCRHLEALCRLWRESPAARAMPESG